eukprot:Gregarina_sp_Poly_1__1674@NODE_142_length_12956_cov_50_914035_g127_i0_p5_GENE_NODE_142_length_12956_cov_50_914035_g127_i0NODE_142_length_12956_cov_50_914035_g127_i0_p5_ORF_typecomplete_len150_score9_36EFG_II/PF14492_6/2_2e02EFG_II/PF14492_6/1_2Kinesin_assoc/PF16183_5/0_068_NODE_142_length_12956_cov_50_914035_g127_i021092558
MSKASQIADSMAVGESRGASRHFMFWVAMQVQTRREQHRYLERLKRGDDLLSDMQRELEDEIRDSEKTIQERIIELDTFTLDSTQATVVEVHYRHTSLSWRIVLSSFPVVSCCGSLHLAICVVLPKRNLSFRVSTTRRQTRRRFGFFVF